MTSLALRYIDPPQLRSALVAGSEIAVIDLRETRHHALDGHLFASISLPLGRLEVDIAAVVPLRNTPIVVHDNGDDELARRGVRKLTELGYSDVRVLAGGTRGWAEAGYEIFTGVNVIGIAFGEFAEHRYGTPHVSANELRTKLDAGENVVVIDSRTSPEFRNFSIPGAHTLPGAELVYRFGQAVTDPDALVVVNCAGRTRSIIGAQALINAGVPNKVVSLANGTMDWLINGYSLDTGRSDELPVIDQQTAQRQATKTVPYLKERFPLSYIGGETLEQFRQEHAAGKRTLYVFDVRSLEEYLRGHLAGSRSAPGGQLVQQVDRWVGTRNARVVLVDNPDLIRASITASWLLQINWSEVHILEDGLAGPVESGPEPLRLARSLPEVAFISPEALHGSDAAPTIIDLDPSLTYREGHIPGAHFALRSDLVADVGKLPGTGPIVLSSIDGSLAAFAAAELQPATDRTVQVLEGGSTAWRNAGFAFERGETSLLHPPLDRRANPYEAPTQDEKFAGFRRYLSWELGLVEQIERDGTANFRTFPQAAG